MGSCLCRDSIAAEENAEIESKTEHESRSAGEFSAPSKHVVQEPTSATILVPTSTTKASDETEFDDMPPLGDLKKFVPPLHIAKVVKVYDGDTLTVGAPLHIGGERKFFKFSVRVAAIDCPELRTKNASEKQVAIEAKSFVQDRILNRIVHLTDIGQDKYGRMLARVSCNGEDLATQLIDAHLAVPYDGGKKTVVEDWVIFRAQAKST